jgi:hypothetical protein
MNTGTTTEVDARTLTRELRDELFDIQDIERRARERLRIARCTLADCKRALVLIRRDRARAEARLLEAMGR